MSGFSESPVAPPFFLLPANHVIFFAIARSIAAFE